MRQMTSTPVTFVYEVLPCCQIDGFTLQRRDAAMVLGNLETHHNVWSRAYLLTSVAGTMLTGY